MVAPSVPRITRIMAGGAIRAAGLPPSMIIEPKTAPRARPMPATVARSMARSALGRDDVEVGGRRLARPGGRCGPGGRRVEEDEDRGPEPAHPVDHLGRALADEVALAVDEGQ